MVTVRYSTCELMELIIPVGMKDTFTHHLGTFLWPLLSSPVFPSQADHVLGVPSGDFSFSHRVGLSPLSTDVSGRSSSNSKTPLGLPCVASCDRVMACHCVDGTRIVPCPYADGHLCCLQCLKKRAAVSSCSDHSYLHLSTETSFSILERTLRWEIAGSYWWCMTNLESLLRLVFKPELGGFLASVSFHIVFVWTCLILL